MHPILSTQALQRQLAERINPFQEIESVKVLIGRYVSTDRPMRYIVQTLHTLRALNLAIHATHPGAQRDEMKIAYNDEQHALVLCALSVRQKFNYGTASSHAQDMPLTVAGFQWFEDLLRAFYIRQQPSDWVTIRKITDALECEPMFLAAVQKYFGLQTFHRRRFHVKPIVEAQEILRDYLFKIGLDELRRVKIKPQ